MQRRRGPVQRRRRDEARRPPLRQGDDGRHPRPPVRGRPLRLAPLRARGWRARATSSSRSTSAATASRRPGPEPRRTGYASDLAAAAKALRKLGKKKIFLVGASMGGLAVARRRRERDAAGRRRRQRLGAGALPRHGRGQGGAHGCACRCSTSPRPRTTTPASTSREDAEAMYRDDRSDGQAARAAAGRGARRRPGRRLREGEEPDRRLSQVALAGVRSPRDPCAAAPRPRPRDERRRDAHRLAPVRRRRPEHRSSFRPGTSSTRASSATRSPRSSRTPPSSPSTRAEPARATGRRAATTFRSTRPTHWR